MANTSVYFNRNLRKFLNKLNNLEEKREIKTVFSLLTMGVGVEAPGRDHHSMSSPNQQGRNMTNGFNSDNHGRSSGGKSDGFLLDWAL